MHSASERKSRKSEPLTTREMTNSPPHDSDVSVWQRQLANAFRRPEEVLAELQLTPESVPGFSAAATGDFPFLVPHSFVARMRVGDAQDPLLLQVLPQSREHNEQDGYVTDAVGDTAARLAPGLIQKYHGRALMIASGDCAVHCRYCFRREYPYTREPNSLSRWQPALDAVRADSSVEEVILSGGDPLVLSDRRLMQLLDAVAAIRHVRRIRIHTRLPIVLPARVTSQLLVGLRNLRPQVIFVVHANHPNEIEADCEDALQTLTRSGIPVLNQSVLLRMINDSADVLAELSRRLMNCGVIPYYLHLPDKVRGTAHFDVPEQTAIELVEQLETVLPGYGVPEVVREVAGEPCKIRVSGRS